MSSALQPLIQDVSPIHQLSVITRLTFREARRRRLLWVGLGLGAVFVGLFALGYFFAYRDFTQQALTGAGGIPGFATDEILEQFNNAILMAGLYVMNFLVIVVTILTSVGAISSEVQTNTIHAIASKPLQRWQIVLGKWIGYALLVTLYTTMLMAGVVLSVFFISGYLPPNLLIGWAIIVLEGLTVLSLTLFGSTIVSTLANGVFVFMLYAVAFIGSWVEQIGALMGSQTAQDLGIASSLLMPADALWRYASGQMQPAGIGNIISPFASANQP
ncbi:MAG: ABC transporter permease subunit, partial [Chloroflexi bacterium]|nr:ABC transporter permease subunit [Chloroflexota bacterium]